MISFELQSDMNNLPQVEEFVDHLCDSCNLGNHRAIITMALLHAVENAILHGNKNDVSKKVFISCEQNLNSLLFRVCDEGEGFPYMNYADYDQLLNGYTDGLFLLRSLCDGLSFEQGGKVVCMNFVINGINNNIALKRASVIKHFYAHSTVGVL